MTTKTSWVENIKIVNAESFTLNIPLKRVLDMAFWGKIKDLPINIIKITTDQDITGYGEVPRLIPGDLLYAGESHETDKKIFDRYISRALIGENPINIERIFEKMNSVVSFNWSLKAGVDMAVHDAAGKSLNVPAYDLLGGKYRDNFPISISVTHMSYEEGRRRAKEWVDQGWKIIKIKVGRKNPKEDIEMVRQVRETIGDDISLRVDANQGYGVKTAIRTIKQMEKYDLTFAEQPTKMYDLEGMARITKSVDIPVMADESVNTLLDVHNIIRLGSADLLSIGTYKGGITLPRKMIIAAEASGLECYIGGTYGTQLGTAASAHLAVATKNVTYGCEALGPYYLAEDIVKGDMFENFSFKDGCMTPPDKPGLGVEIDEEKMKKYLID